MPDPDTISAVHCGAEEGDLEGMRKDLGASPGSKATPEAPAGLRPSGYDPARDLPNHCYDKELRLFTQTLADLWRAIQEDELCDLTECTFKFGGNCHCMGTLLALSMDAMNDAIESERTGA